MSINNTTEPKEIKHLKFLESEVGFEKHEKLLNTIENLSRQLNEVKSQLVYNSFEYFYFSSLNNNFIKN